MSQSLSHPYLGKYVICFNDDTIQCLLLFVYVREVRGNGLIFYIRQRFIAHYQYIFYVTLYVESNYRCQGITPYCVFNQRYLDNKMHLIYFLCPQLDLYLATIYCSSISSIFTMASVSLRFCITDKGIMNAMVFFRYQNTLPYQI